MDKLGETCSMKELIEHIVSINSYAFTNRNDRFKISSLGKDNSWHIY